MDKTILSSAFSLQMLSGSVKVDFKEVSFDYVRKMLPADFISAVGHADTAAVLSTMLDKTVEFARINVSIDPYTTMYVAQLTGGRLPEGATTLPDGFSFKFYKVELIEEWEISAVAEDGEMVSETFIGTYSDAIDNSYGLIPYDGKDVRCSVRKMD